MQNEFKVGDKVRFKSIGSALDYFGPVWGTILCQKVAETTESSHFNSRIIRIHFKSNDCSTWVLKKDIIPAEINEKKDHYHPLTKIFLP